MTAQPTPARPWFGLHLPSYTFPDTPPARLFDRVVEQARAAEDAGFSLVTVMDHLYQIPIVGPATEPMLEAWSTLAALARETIEGPARDAGQRRHVPQSGAPRQAGHDARHALGWSRHPRPRGCLERGGARRLRLRLPAPRRADGPPRRGADDHPGDVPRGSAELHGTSLRASSRLSTSHDRSARRPAGARRRRRRAADPADRREARGSHPLVPAGARGTGTQDRAPAALLRRDRARSVGHRADHGDARSS